MLPPILVASNHCNALALRLQCCRQNGELLDCKIRVDTADGYKKELFVHKLVLFCSSNILKQSVSDEKDEDGLQEISLHLESNADVTCLEALITFMYTGQLLTANCKPLILKRLASMFEINDVISLIQPYCCFDTEITSQTHLELPITAAREVVTVIDAIQQMKQGFMQNMLSLDTMMLLANARSSIYSSFPESQFCGNVMFPNNNSLLSTPGAFMAINKEMGKSSLKSQHTNNKNKAMENAISEMQIRRIPQNRKSAGRINEIRNGKNEVIVPSNDHEGWCRNKKYIERVPTGFMCTVCRKIYGRYNSVSYHVTIYHRNPPIRCDEDGCQFSTREARYIHFHKFYRHRIPLPGSIDLGPRRCAFCRHVSKSPAMLEKHIKRHLQECVKTGKEYRCAQCEKQTCSQKEMLDHMILHAEDEAGFDCQQ